MIFMQSALAFRHKILESSSVYTRVICVGAIIYYNVTRCAASSLTNLKRLPINEKLCKTLHPLQCHNTVSPFVWLNKNHYSSSRSQCLLNSVGPSKISRHSQSQKNCVHRISTHIAEVPRACTNAKNKCGSLQNPSTSSDVSLLQRNRIQNLLLCDRKHFLDNSDPHVCEIEQNKIEQDLITSHDPTAGADEMDNKQRTVSGSDYRIKEDDTVKPSVLPASLLRKVTEYVQTNMQDEDKRPVFTVQLQKPLVFSGHRISADALPYCSLGYDEVTASGTETGELKLAHTRAICLAKCHSCHFAQYILPCVRNFCKILFIRGFIPNICCVW